MFRCDRKCDGCDEKFGNFVGTKHTRELNTTAPSWTGLVGAGSYETLQGRPRPVTAPCAYAPSGWS